MEHAELLTEQTESALEHAELEVEHAELLSEHADLASEHGRAGPGRPRLALKMLDLASGRPREGA